MGTIDLRGDGVNTEMETGSRSTAAPIVAHRASWSEKFRGTPLTEANQAIQAYAWTVGQLRYAQLPHSPTTQPQPDISFATESGHLHLLLTAVFVASGALVLATLNVNVTANVVSPANDFSNLYPSRISFKRGAIIACLLGLAIQPWKLLASYGNFLRGWQ